MNIHIPHRVQQTAVGLLTAGVVGMLGMTVFSDTTFSLTGSVAGSQASAGPVCGNGHVEEGERCDDGNAWFGDGCTHCQVEAGYSCQGEPSVCAAGQAQDASQSAAVGICGDGVIDPATEQCDDGNGTPGDGCDASCLQEANFSCAGSPSQCNPDTQTSACGNGKIDGTEQCDDGNPIDGDGCSQACLWEPGFTCVGQPSKCEKNANAMSSSSAETSSATSASSQSSAASSAASPSSSSSASKASSSSAKSVSSSSKPASSAPSSSSASSFAAAAASASSGASSTSSAAKQTITAPISECGDGYISGSEQCDDKNTRAGDGCSSTCTFEAGFTCTDIPSRCVEHCGDGVLTANETCDDANTLDGDGCSSTCHEEFGFSCTNASGTKSSCHQLTPASSSSSSASATSSSSSSTSSS